MRPLPALVLLPGLDGTGELFNSLVEELVNDIHCEIISYPHNETWGYDELDDYVRGRLPADTPFVLLAESFSGPIAVRIGSTPPENMVGLILCCTFVRNPRTYSKYFGPAMELVPLSIIPIKLICQYSLGDYSTDKLVSDVVSVTNKVSDAVIKERLKSVMSVDVTEQIKSITLPTVYLQAKQDRLVPEEASALFSEMNPDINMIGIDGPHFLLQACASHAANEIRKFYKQYVCVTQLM